MKNIIIEMLLSAEKSENYELISYARRLIDELAVTANAPSNWREIGEQLVRQYTPDTWIYEELELWNYDTEKI